MKNTVKTVFIGNRPSVLDSLCRNPRIDLVHALALNGSMIGADANGGKVTFVSACGDRERVLNVLFNAEYDLCVSAGCPYIIPVKKLPADRVFINSHPSVLPLGRGKHPINECLLSGNNVAGATLHFLSDGLDEGDIISQASFELTDDLDLDILYSFIFDLECEVFEHGLQKLLNSGFTYKGRPQTGKTTYFSRQVSDAFFDIASGNADDLVRRVRAFSSDNLGIRVHVDGEELSLHRASRVRNRFLEERYKAIEVGTAAIRRENVLIVKLRDGLVRFDRWRTGTASLPQHAR